MEVEKTYSDSDRAILGALKSRLADSEIGFNKNKALTVYCMGSIRQHQHLDVELTEILFPTENTTNFENVFMIKDGDSKLFLYKEFAAVVTLLVRQHEKIAKFIRKNFDLMFKENIRVEAFLLISQAMPWMQEELCDVFFNDKGRGIRTYNFCGTSAEDPRCRIERFVRLAEKLPWQRHALFQILKENFEYFFCGIEDPAKAFVEIVNVLTDQQDLLLKMFINQFEALVVNKSTVTSDFIRIAESLKRITAEPNQNAHIIGIFFDRFSMFCPYSHSQMKNISLANTMIEVIVSLEWSEADISKVLVQKGIFKTGQTFENTDPEDFLRELQGIKVEPDVKLSFSSSMSVERVVETHAQAAVQRVASKGKPLPPHDSNLFAPPPEQSLVVGQDVKMGSGSDSDCSETSSNGSLRTQCGGRP